VMKQKSETSETKQSKYCHLNRSNFMSISTENLLSLNKVRSSRLTNIMNITMKKIETTNFVIRNVNDVNIAWIILIFNVAFVSCQFTWRKWLWYEVTLSMMSSQWQWSRSIVSSTVTRWRC
jgi:hypothetical protein